MIFEKQILNAYKGMMHTRCDDTETVFYFSPSDFPNLRAESHPFTSCEGNLLKGYVYYYDNPIQNRIVVFDHGFGGGHRAYMKEIEKLCKHGFMVFAYDHTGCMESGGATPGGLAHSLCDLNDCINMIKSDKRFQNLDISVMGHSWGAFSTLNIAAFHSDISHIVAMCGFVSVEEMTKTFFSGLLKGYQKAVFELEKKTNPYFADFNAIATLSKSNVKALLIYSDNDQMCRRVHHDMLKEALEDKKNVNIMLCHNKGHNPNYTEEAVKLVDEFGKARAKFAKKKNATREEKAQFVSSFDFDAMTVQDEAVWNEIFKHLDN